MKRILVSIVVPAYNEAANVQHFYDSLTKVLLDTYDYEFVFVDDGSKDETCKHVAALHRLDERVRLVTLARNFGKEVALTAGIKYASGEAIVTLDADGQHPVELVSQFIEVWGHGKVKVVIGVRLSNQREGLIKHYGSKVFYRIFNSVTGSKLVPGSSDFRLIDKEVRDEFLQLPEVNRITRGLIDWLGFEPAYINFHANARIYGKATYSFRKLLNLAVNSFVSLSFAPLFLFGYIGVIITSLSFLMGIFMFIERFLLHDPWHLQFSNTSALAVLIIFLVGIVLMAQGLTALYISHIYSESKRRPLYVVNKGRSIL